MTLDPYEVLGVEVGASHDEIAAAYRRLAALHHPDRHVGAPPEELARLQVRMAAINEAYAALRSLPPPPPLAPPPRPPRTEGNSWRNPPAVAFEERPRRRRRRWPYVLLVFAVLGATFGVVAAATSNPPTGVTTTWSVGSCVQGTSDLTAVRCDGPHDGKITNVESDADDCPATTDGVVADRGYIWCIDTDQ